MSAVPPAIKEFTSFFARWTVPCATWYLWNTVQLISPFDTEVSIDFPLMFSITLQQYCRILEFWMEWKLLKRPQTHTLSLSPSLVRRTGWGKERKVKAAPKCPDAMAHSLNNGKVKRKRQGLILAKDGFQNCMPKRANSNKTLANQSPRISVCWAW